MQKNNNLFLYNNKIILTNGSSLKITSIKYLKNYQLNIKLFKEKKNLNKNINKNNLIFLKKISI
jgi:hypothetical protein